jgi:hypothetical protein
MILREPESQRLEHATSPVLSPHETDSLGAGLSRATDPSSSKPDPQINTLPSELLEIIFFKLLQPVLDEDGNVWYPPKQWDADVPLLCLQAATTLSLVCKLWREIIIRSARLWNCIDSPKGEHAEELLARSRSAPLTLLLRHGCEHVNTFLPPALPRLTELVVSQPSPERPIEPLIRLLTISSTPNLRSVTVRYDGDLSSVFLPDVEVMPARAEAFHEYMRVPKPALEYLSLQNAVISAIKPTPIDVFPVLRSLRLSTLTILPQESLYQLLSAMPNLESLSIETAYILRQGLTGTTAPGPVFLPHLRSLSVLCDSIDSVPYFSLIRPPLALDAFFHCEIALFTDPSHWSLEKQYLAEVYALLGLSSQRCSPLEGASFASSYPDMSLEFKRNDRVQITHLGYIQDRVPARSVSVQLVSPQEIQPVIWHILYWESLTFPDTVKLVIRWDTDVYDDDGEGWAISLRRFLLSNPGIRMLVLELDTDCSAEILRWTLNVLSPIIGEPALLNLGALTLSFGQEFEEEEEDYWLQLFSFFSTRALKGCAIPCLRFKDTPSLSPEFESKMRVSIEEMWRDVNPGVDLEVALAELQDISWQLP